MISTIRRLIRTGPAAHVFTVTLQPGTSARDRQRYFRRMQRDLIRRGLIVNYCACDGGPTLCMAVMDHDARWRTDRHLYVGWLIDQPQTRHVYLLPSPPLQQLIEDERGVLSKLIHAGQQEGQGGHWPLARVVGGLVIRMTYRLRAKSEVAMLRPHPPERHQTARGHRPSNEGFPAPSQPPPVRVERQLALA